MATLKINNENLGSNNKKKVHTTFTHLGYTYIHFHALINRISASNA